MRKLLILLIASAFVVALAAPAMARYGSEGMEITFDGRVQIDTYWFKNDKENSRITNPVTLLPEDDSGLRAWDDSGSDTRVRMHFKKGPFKAMIDLRSETTDVDDGFDVYWAEWNFGPGSLWIGKDDPLTFNPIHLPPPQKSGWGHYIGYSQEDGIKLKFPVGPALLQFLAMTPTQVQGVAGIPGNYDRDQSMPALEARVDFPLGPVKVAISGGMESYSVVATNAKAHDIDSHVIGLCLRWFAGPFSLHGTIYKDVNNYSHGGPPKGLAGFGNPFWDGVNQVIDSECTAWGLAASYTLNDMLTFHVGYSEQDVESDTSVNFPYANKDEAQGWEIAAVIKITEFFSITPFYNVTDLDTRTPGGAVINDPIEEGKQKAYGARWTIEW